MVRIMFLLNFSRFKVKVGSSVIASSKCFNINCQLSINAIAYKQVDIKKLPITETLVKMLKPPHICIVKMIMYPGTVFFVIG